MKDFIVLDTNILVSAALLPNSIASRVLRKAVTEFSIATSIACFDEFAEVLLRPKFRKYLDLKNAIDIIESYQQISKFVPITHSVTDCRDSKDNKFLELALSSSASYIVTGDSDLLVLHPYKNTQIISPAQFVA